MSGVINKTALVAVGTLVLLVGVVYFGLTAIPEVTNVAANPNQTTKRVRVDGTC